jgi:YHS domain-containing protein
MRGRLGRDEPLGSVKRVSLQERINRWIGQALARMVQKLLASAIGDAAPRSMPRPQTAPRSAIALHRDPWCGTYVSPEISFPLEQAGQMLHFCSAECRARYERLSKRAASA